MENDKQAIRTLMANWLDAMRAGDADALLALATPDVMFLTPDQPPQDRSQIDGTLRALFAMNMVGATMEVDEIEVCGDLAFARTTMKVTITSKYGFAPITCRGHTLSVVRRTDDGRWLLARDASLLAPVERARHCLS